MRGRLFAVLALSFATSAVSMDAATAASAACTKLKAQLASVSGRQDSSGEHRRYADAVARQREQMRKVQSDLTRFGCTSGSFIVVGGANAATCQKLSSAHVKMRANVGALERKRDSFAGRGGAQARRRIEAALKANDCDTPKPAVTIAAKAENPRRVTAVEAVAPAPRRERAKSPGLVAVIGKSGGATLTMRPSQDIAVTAPSGARIVIEPRSSGGGNLRTVCVRTCDGYFFPISSTATSMDFGRDEKACKMMCPGTQAELYYHSVPDQESEAMVSARTQAPYSDLPTAFQYRNTAPAMSRGCSCNMTAFYKEMSRREALYNGTLAEAPVTTWVRPSARPDPGEDPETIVNLRASLTDTDIAAVTAATNRERPITDKDAKVRVVGPAFLPDQSEKLDLTSGADRLFR